jgi:quinol monooxygenase YgiN
MIVRIEANAAQRRELAQALLQWAADAMDELGVLAAEVYEDMGAPNAFCLVSRWANRQALGSHTRGPAFGSMLGAVELLASRSRVALTETAQERDADLSLRWLRDPKRMVAEGGERS